MTVNCPQIKLLEATRMKKNNKVTLFDDVTVMYNQEAYVSLASMLAHAVDEALEEMGITCENCIPGNDPNKGCTDLCIIMNAYLMAEEEDKEVI